MASNELPQRTIMIRDTNVTVTDILELIARGNTYSQIVKELPSIAMSDIMASAAFARDIIQTYVRSDMTLMISGEVRLITKGSRLINLTELRKRFPRAYENWTTAEETRLIEMQRQGKDTNQIAAALGRQPGAVRSRLQTLGLIDSAQSEG